MKYVRIKDKIGKIFLDEGVDYCPEQLELINSCEQSDNIEDLCDEFVVINNADKRPAIRHFFSEAKDLLEKAKAFVGTKEKHDVYVDYLYERNPNFKYEINLYGHIWVDGSLIKVAKMNEQGKLELI